MTNQKDILGDVLGQKLSLTTADLQDQLLNFLYSEMSKESTVLPFRPDEMEDSLARPPAFFYF